MNNKKTQKAWWEPALEIFIKVSGWIAFPIIGALFLGRYLDERYGTEPWIFLGLTGLAFIISSIGIIIETVRYMNELAKENNKSNQITSDEDNGIESTDN